MLSSIEQLANFYEQNSDYNKALSLALQYCEIDQWNEDMQCKVMRLYALNGQNNAAINQYESTCNFFKNELGTEPRKETHHLARRIRSGEISAHRNEKTLENIVCELYRSVDQPDQWMDVAGKIANLVGAERFLFASRDKVNLEMKGDIYWGLGDEAYEAYISHYSNVDILSQRLEHAPQNRFHISYDLCPDQLYFKSELYNDFCKPFDIHYSTGVAFSEPDSSTYTQFACLWGADTKAFDTNDIKPLNSLVAHLQQFVRLRQKFEHLEQQTRSSDQITERFTTPAFLCNRHGQILSRNTQTESLFSTSEILTALGESIVFFQNHHQLKFETLLYQAINATDAKARLVDGRWHIQDGNKTLEVSIFPFTYRAEGSADNSQPCALIVIT
ncbi:MAG: bacterial transcriptional activator domain-containing protein [Gammaproteobacteria bacterium]|nr:bacterial transcriptional activator domain-containing protein [Gammaproteobacteria bacterium]